MAYGEKAALLGVEISHPALRRNLEQQFASRHGLHCRLWHIADIGGLPPTLIHTAEFDPLRDEGRDYFERLARANAEVSYTFHPGMIHLFYGLGAVIPYARTAFEQIGGEIRAALA